MFALSPLVSPLYIQKSPAHCGGHNVVVLNFPRSLSGPKQSVLDKRPDWTRLKKKRKKNKKPYEQIT